MENREAIHKLIMFRRILERGVFPVGYRFDAEPFDLAISALEKQDRWNPCSEKMPDEPFGCFVTVMDTNPITQEEFENILPYFVGWDGKQWNDADGEQIPCEVLAWRQIPKPYKLEEES